ncbi:MAG: hypothetical protein ACE5NG_21265, partial [bacterium]
LPRPHDFSINFQRQSGHPRLRTLLGDPPDSLLSVMSIVILIHYLVRIIPRKGSAVKENLGLIQ